ncbi:scarecrow-like protein 22 [Dorcoceras hygrometricum]|uniref:Scarecrow-like protein 22 n=1 Tax=Dorcoceras hygrometricum TaxID=472368 RepID=A0A2Z7CJJ4_9LAMI|nr:scarecrow-like protein 22 [Dorcoceras hygrometricum]
MIEMQYNYNDLRAKGTGGGFASSSFEANFKKDGTFTKIEPISVLDTRSPSPSTSTSTFPLYNNATQAGNTAANKHTMVASATTGGGGGGEEEYSIGPLSLHDGALELCGHWISDKFNLGVEERENFSESAASQSEILKLFLQAGNQNVFQCNMGFGAMDTGLEFTGFSGSTLMANDFSSYNTPLLSLSESGFSFNDNKDLFGSDSNCVLSHNNGNTLACLGPGTVFEHQHEILEEKAEIFNPQVCLTPSVVQNAANLSMTNFNPSIFGTQQEQHHRLQSCHNNPNVGITNSKLCSQNRNVQFVDSGLELLIMKQQQSPQILQHLEDGKKKPLLVPKHETVDGCLGQLSTIPSEQQQVVCDLLYKVAESMMAGNFSNAQGILARLNQLLSPIAEPFLRSAFYVKEALQSVLVVPNHIAPVPPRIPTPFDGMFKMGAYKVFSDVSPVIQFTNFTANQAFLEALDNSEHIHVIDFDIGFGAHWSSFLQELPRKNGGVISVKITAFVSPCSHHAIEISLMHENLAHFANGLGIKFELDVVNIDSFDPNSGSVSLFRSSESEAIAVNFPIWSFTSCLSSLPSYISLIKKLSPKIIVSLDRGFERIDLPFSHHILHTLQYYEALLASVDATNMASDAAKKIEKFLFQPRIESTVFGRLFYSDIMPPWRNLFTTAGFLPAPISSFSLTQADCVLKRTQVRGFHVEKQQASLVLCWQQCELISISAWTC